MKALIFCAHGDDETSLAGTIKKMIFAGWSVHIVIGTLQIGNKIRMSKETDKVMKLLGISSYEILNFRSWINENRKLVSVFDMRIQTFKPNFIFTHWMGDSHIEHKLVTAAVLHACRRSKVNILTYKEPNIGGQTMGQFSPILYVDISTTYKIKIKTIEQYKSQLKKYRFWLQATEGMAKYYGSIVQTKYAEAFEVIKMTWDF